MFTTSRRKRAVGNRYGQYIRNPGLPVPKSTRNRWNKQLQEQRNPDPPVVIEPPPQGAPAIRAPDFPHRDNNVLDPMSEDEADDQGDAAAGPQVEVALQPRDHNSSESDSSESHSVNPNTQHGQHQADNDLDVSHNDNDLEERPPDSFNSTDSDISSSDEEPEQNREPNLHVPDFWLKSLYPGSKVSIGQAVIDILEFYTEHKLTKAALGHLLQMISNFLPKCHLLPTSKFKFLNLLSEHTESFEIKRHRFCDDCHNYFGLYEETLEVEVCPACQSKNIEAMFIEIPIMDTLILLLEKCNIFESFVKKSADNKIIADIVDGKSSRALGEGQFDFHLLWNTDGAPVFKSSTGQIWPLLYTVCNLSPKLRNRYICLAGLWYSKKKTTMNVFLKPFTDSLIQLESVGVKWFYAKQKRFVRSIVRAPLISVDSKARSDMQGMVACNGEQSCSFCEHPTELFIITNRSRVRVFPTLEQEPQLRDKKRMHQQSLEAMRTGRAIKGVKIASCLSTVKSIDPAKSFVPDPLHMFYQGVMRAMLLLWTTSKYFRNDWYIGREKNRINFRLRKIKLPYSAGRSPRTLEDMPHWKASEYRSFALWYGPICLKNILPEQYYQNFLLFSAAVFLLSQQVVTHKDVKAAESFFSLFCTEYEKLYGKRNMSFNVHQLLHIASAVQNWGPCWAFSCFPFESMNGELLLNLHGTQRIAEQLVGTTKLHRSLLILRHTLDMEVEKQDTDTAIPLGAKCSGAKLNGDFFVIVQQYIYAEQGPPEVPFTDLIFYQRIRIKGKGQFSTEYYKRGEKRDNTVIEYCTENEVKYGKLQAFATILGRAEVYAVIKCLVVNNENPKIVHRNTNFALKQFKTIHAQNLAVINVTRILRSAINFHTFIARIPNDIEINL